MSILRLRDVRLIVGAVGLSAVGDAVLWILLAFHVGTTAGSALAVSAMFVCLWGPVVALGGVAGRIVDRYENRRLLIGVSLAQAAVVAAMASSPPARSPSLLGLCVLLGAGVAVSSPAEFALLPAAAGEDRLAEANGQVEAARYLGMTAGPMLGGVLAAAGSIEVGLLLDAASFLARRGARGSRCAPGARRGPRAAAAARPRPRGHRRAARRRPHAGDRARRRDRLAALLHDLRLGRGVLRHRRARRRRGRLRRADGGVDARHGGRRRRAGPARAAAAGSPSPRWPASRSRAPGCSAPRPAPRWRSPCSAWRSAAPRTASRTSCCAP